MAYTPFLADIGKTMGQGMAQQGQNELIQSAYMGEPGAMEQLAAVNPQAAQSIRKEKVSTEQTALQGQKTKSTAMEQLRKIKADVQKQVAGFDTFEEAKPFYDQQVQMNQELINLAGITPEQLELTPQAFEQIKQAEGTAKDKPFEGKGMEAQTSNLLVQGVTDPAFRKTPEYARAYQLASEPKIVKTPTGDILVPPNLPPIFKAPGEIDTPEDEQLKNITSKSAADAKEIEESEGKPKYIPGTEKPMKYSEGEKLSSGFYDRMTNSESNILKLGDFDPADAKEVAYGLSNITASQNMQLYRQAANDWIRAKLRKESGAVIADDEMASEYATYFPKLGDSAAVIKQKNESRAIAVASMKKNAGNIIKEEEEKAKGAKPKTKAKASGQPKAGDIVGGYKFKGGDPSKQENWEQQ